MSIDNMGVPRPRSVILSGAQRSRRIQTSNVLQDRVPGRAILASLTAPQRRPKGSLSLTQMQKIYLLFYKKLIFPRFKIIYYIWFKINCIIYMCCFPNFCRAIAADNHNVRHLPCSISLLLVSWLLRLRMA